MAEATGNAKSVDLGSKPSRVMEGPVAPQKYYPCLNVDKVKGSPLNGKKAGDTFEATVQFKVKEMTSNDDGSVSLRLEAKSLTMV